MRCNFCKRIFFFNENFCKRLFSGRVLFSVNLFQVCNLCFNFRGGGGGEMSEG